MKRIVKRRKVLDNKEEPINLGLWLRRFCKQKNEIEWLVGKWLVTSQKTGAAHKSHTHTHAK